MADFDSIHRKEQKAMQCELSGKLERLAAAQMLDANRARMAEK